MIKGRGMPQHKGMASRCDLVSTKILAWQLLACRTARYVYGIEWEGGERARKLKLSDHNTYIIILTEKRDWEREREGGRDK